MRKSHFSNKISSRRAKLIIIATTLTIIALAGAYAYEQIQQHEIIQFLTRYHAYSPDFKYEPLIVLDVDALSKSGGNVTVKDLTISYRFNAADEYDDVPYLKLTYDSGPPCNISQFPSSTNCREMLVIIPVNNLTNESSLTQIHALYAGPLNNFGFDLQTETGTHIEWHLYLFLATYVGGDQSGLHA